MIFLPEAFCPAQDLLCCLYHIMIGCQCKHIFYYLHLIFASLPNSDMGPKIFARKGDEEEGGFKAK